MLQVQNSDSEGQLLITIQKKNNLKPWNLPSDVWKWSKISQAFSPSPHPSLFQVQSGKDSGPRRKAPGIPVNKDTAATKLGKHEVSVTKSERRGLHRMSFFLCFFGFRPREAIPSLPRRGCGEILITAFRSHYSKPRCPRYLNSGAIVDSARRHDLLLL